MQQRFQWRHDLTAIIVTDRPGRTWPQVRFPLVLENWTCSIATLSFRGGSPFVTSVTRLFIGVILGASFVRPWFCGPWRRGKVRKERKEGVRVLAPKETTKDGRRRLYELGENEGWRTISPTEVRKSFDQNNFYNLDFLCTSVPSPPPQQQEF